MLLLISTGSGRLEKRIEPSQLESYTIGRGSDTTLFLNDRGVSRHHCRMYAKDDHVLIEDSGSSGGTWLNDQRLTAPAQLNDGDEVQIGAVRIKCAFESDALQQRSKLLSRRQPRHCQRHYWHHLRRVRPRLISPRRLRCALQ